MSTKKARSFFRHKTTLFVLGLFLVVAIWEIVAFATGFLFVPEFFSTVARAFSLLGEARTWNAIGFTLLRLCLSFIASATLGVFLGTLAGYFEPLGNLLRPLILLLRALPTVALILLLIVHVPMASLWVVGLVLFPVIYQASLEGSSKAYADFEKLIRLQGKRHINNITRVVLPLSMDYVLLGFVQSIGLGMKVEIMAETFAYSSNRIGLGQMIYSSYQQVDYERLMALVLICLLLVFLLDGLMKGMKTVIERKLNLSKEQIES